MGAVAVAQDEQPISRTYQYRKVISTYCFSQVSPKSIKLCCDVSSQKKQQLHESFY